MADDELGQLVQSLPEEQPQVTRESTRVYTEELAQSVTAEAILQGVDADNYRSHSRRPSANVEVRDPTDDIPNVRDIVRNAVLSIFNDGDRRRDLITEGDLNDIASRSIAGLERGGWSRMANRMTPEGRLPPDTILYGETEESRIAQEEAVRNQEPMRLTPASPEEQEEQRLEAARFQAQYGQYTQPRTEQLGQHNLLRQGVVGILEGVLGPYHAFVRAWEDESAGYRASPEDVLAVAVPAAIPGASLPRTVPQSAEISSLTGNDLRYLAPGMRTPQSIVDDMSIPPGRDIFPDNVTGNIPNIRNMTDEEFSAFMSSAPDRTPYDRAVIDQRTLQQNRDELADYIRGGFRVIEGGNRTTTQDMVGEVFSRYNIPEQSIRIRTPSEGSAYYDVRLPNGERIRARLSDHPRTDRDNRPSSRRGEIDISTPEGLKELERRVREALSDG